MNEQSQPHFSDNLPQVEHYQAFPMGSLIVFVVALLASILALVNPKLLSLPMLTAILALFSLVVLHTRKSTSQAFMFVAAALAISLFSFAFRATYQTLRYDYLEATAIKNADTWLSLVKQNRLQEAIEMSRPRAERTESGTDLNTVYGTLDDPKSDLKTYVEVQPELEIRGIGEDAELTVDFVEYDQPHNRHDVFRINYRLHRTEKDEEDYLFSIAMLRIRPIHGDVFWEFKQLKPIRPMFPRNRRGIGVFGGTQDSEVFE